MLRSVRVARQDVLRTTAQGTTSSSAEPNPVELEAAVDRDMHAFESAVQATISLGEWGYAVIKMHHTMLDVLRQEVQRSAFIMLAAARTLGCQVKPLASRPEMAMPGWLCLPPGICSLCMRFLDEIDVPGYGDLNIGHALSHFQKQAVLSFASDRRTIGYARLNEVLLASKRLEDEAAVEAWLATSSAQPWTRRLRSWTVVQSPMPAPAISAVPMWSWKKAAERACHEILLRYSIRVQRLQRLDLISDFQVPEHDCTYLGRGRV